LRAALLDAGLKALETRDIAELSLRQLARETGVSPTAVYRHFPDKNALMQALAEAGIAEMARWQRDAALAAEPDQAFAATGRAYVRWALANPALFKLVFGHCAVGREVFGDNEASEMLRGYAQTFAQSADEVQRFMFQAWAVAHGLAMLMLDGQLPADEALIDRVIDAKTLFRAAA